MRISILFSITAMLVLLLAGAAFAGFRYERARAARILPGVSIAGMDVGGMSRAEALHMLEPTATAILDRSIDVHAAGKSWTLTAEELGTRVDVTAAVDRALSISAEYGWPTRLFHRLLNRPVDHQVALGVTHDDSAVDPFVKGIAVELKRDPRDAYLDFADGHLAAQHSRTGRALRTGLARKALVAAVRGGASSVDLELRTVEPSTADDSLGKTIIVRVSENRLYLYDGLKLEKTYRVATGQLDLYPTPLGHFQVINKRINPTWYNPAKDTWGKDEPDFIPPGPDNPLGTLALDLDAPGIRIHGTPADYSIGTWASHGCIRMHIPESEQLFGLVDVGTPVIIAW
jgi:lipoprotein-anchoring transpeptidase ErfK/SrfK